MAFEQSIADESAPTERGALCLVGADSSAKGAGENLAYLPFAARTLSTPAFALASFGAIFRQFW
jgi:hypothetical protein